MKGKHKRVLLMGALGAFVSGQVLKSFDTIFMKNIQNYKKKKKLGYV